MSVSQEPVLTVAGLWATDVDTSATLHNVSFRVAAGRVTVVHDPRSEALQLLSRCLLGRHAPARGHIVVAGIRLAPAHLGDNAGWQRTMVHRVARRLPPVQQTALDFIARQEQLRNGLPHSPRSLAILTRLGLRSLADSPVHLLTPAQRAAVNLGAALVWDPAVLFVDRPEEVLEPDEASKHLNQLRALADLEGRTVLIATTGRSADAVADSAVAL